MDGAGYGDAEVDLQERADGRKKGAERCGYFEKPRRCRLPAVSLFVCFVSAWRCGAQGGHGSARAAAGHEVGAARGRREASATAPVRLAPPPTHAHCPHATKMKRKQYRIRQGEAAENTPSGHPMRRCRQHRAPKSVHWHPIPLSTQSKSAPMPSVDELEKEIEECAHALARMHPSATRAFARDRGNPLASRAR